MAILVALNFVNLIAFSLLKVQKFIKIKIQSLWSLNGKFWDSEWIRQLWCHVKTQWQPTKYEQNQPIWRISSPQFTMLQKLSKCEVKAWLCWKIIFSPLRFYVKSNFGELKQSKLSFFDILVVLNFWIWQVPNLPNFKVKSL